MEIYLDNSATTKCLDDAVKLMNEALSENFGNPSSLHGKGVTAENYLKEARKKVAKSLKCDEKEIFFTSGGSESDSTAILGAVDANPRVGKHIIISDIEHPAVEKPCEYLEANGYDITRLPVDREGNISLDHLSNIMRQRTDTVLVSIMHVNNEIGTVEPVEKAADIVHLLSQKALIHVDATQSYGKIPIFPKKSRIDLLSVSGHKIHGPKGSGFLYARKGIKLRPLIFGGGQEDGMRSGTENVPAIAGLGVACDFMNNAMEEHLKDAIYLRTLFTDQITSIPGVTVNGPAKLFGDGDMLPSDGKTGKVLPYIISVSVKNVRAEVLLHALEEKGIYVSAGSACSSNRPAVSRTLKAIGLDSDLLESTVRFSMSCFTTEEEMKAAADAMKELVPSLSKYRRY